MVSMLLVDLKTELRLDARLTVKRMKGARLTVQMMRDMSYWDLMMDLMG